MEIQRISKFDYLTFGVEYDMRVYLCCKCSVTYPCILTHVKGHITTNAPYRCPYMDLDIDKEFLREL